jgi:Transcriptional regulatory protein, C terminal
MGTIANNHTSGLQPAMAPTVQRAIHQDPRSAIRATDPDEMPGICGFTNFFVLFAKSAGKSGITPSQTLESDVFPVLPASFDSLDVFKTASKPARKHYSDSDAMVGAVKVNFATMEADRQGEPILLTALEFKTLRFLIANARRVITRDELLNEVWGYHNYPCTRTVDNVVAKLRKKLEEHPARPVHLRTVYGVGYKFLP